MWHMDAPQFCWEIIIIVTGGLVGTAARRDKIKFGVNRLAFNSNVTVIKK